HRKGLSFPLEYFHRIPCFIGRGLFVFQRTVEVCFCQVILGVKFQEAREQNFRLNEIAIAKLANSFLVRFQPDQQFLIERSVTRPSVCQALFRLNNSRRIPGAACAAALASLATPWLLTFPHTAMMASPINLSSVPSY